MASVGLPGSTLVDPDEDPSQFSYQISELSIASALNSLKFSQVVIVVVEGEQGRFSKVDLQLAKKCLEEGRAVVIAANKRDLMAMMGIAGKDYEAAVRAHCATFIKVSAFNKDFIDTSYKSISIDCYFSISYSILTHFQSTLISIPSGVWRCAGSHLLCH
jgi:predicted GTPase